MRAPDRLDGALQFTAARFVATATELDAARATLAEVRAALLMGGQSAEIRCRAALAALADPAPTDSEART